ncbi:MAG: hypothetical protein ACHQQS_01035 [Thermoanaerobaculales bacterium]
MMLAFFTRERKGPAARYGVSHDEVGWPAKKVFLESDAALLEFLSSAGPQRIAFPGALDSFGKSTLESHPVTLEAAYREILALREESQEMVRLKFFEANFREAFLALVPTEA